MWLINTKTLKLEYFISSKIPKYAILSHTWEDRESSFQDFVEEPIKDSVKSRKGYHKIKKTCEEAQKHNLSYAWVDTCCIDKSSSAELTENINSMYSWYQRAEICFVYLSDLQAGVIVKDHLAGCRWFTRGWTLQELIAPSEIHFYNQEWSFIGNKMSFSKLITSVTGIQTPVLSGHFDLNEYSVAERMFWAAHRETTRTEDLAYCLLGIFDVNMPLIYGEGARAFRRLQEAIIARRNDMTIFAWDHETELEDGVQRSLFSSSPAGFANCSQVRQFPRASFNFEFAITNKGLRFHDFKFFYEMWTGQENETAMNMKMKYLLLLGCFEDENGKSIYHAIPLQKIGPNMFCRDGKLFIEDQATSFNMPSRSKHLRFVNDFHIQLDPQDYRQFQALHFPYHEEVQIQEVIPHALWNEPDRILFLDSVITLESDLLAAVLCTVHLKSISHQVMVCIWSKDEALNCTIFAAKKFENHHSWITRHIRRGHQGTWNGFDDERPRYLEEHTDTTDLAVGLYPDTFFTVFVQIEENYVKGNKWLDSLKFHVKENENWIYGPMFPTISIQ